MRESKASLHENIIHGRTNFPFVVYHGRMPEWLKGYPLHWHEEFEIIFISFGQGVFNVQGTKYLCKQGDILIIPPQKIHSIEQNQNEHCSYYNIMFDLSLLEENPDSLCAKKFFSRYEQNSELDNYLIKADTQLNSLIFPLVKELAGFWEKDFEKVALLIKARLFEILYHLDNSIVSKSSKYTSRKTSKSDRLKKILLYIKEHFAEQITIDQIASEFNLSASRFMKVFHQETGRSFIQYLNDYRLEQAALDLINTGNSVTQIAQANGFESISYFILLFKRKFNTTPDQYRKHLEKE